MGKGEWRGCEGGVEGMGRGSGGDGKGEWRGWEGGVEGMGRGSGGDGKEDGVVSVSTKHCHIRIHMRRT